MSAFQAKNHSLKIFTKRHKELSGRFDAQFYWENMNFDNCIKLSTVAKVSGGKRLPKGYDYSKDKTSYRYLRIGDIDRNGNLDYENFEYLSEDLFGILEHYEINTGDLMLAIVGATIGKCSLLNPPYADRIILTENCAKIKVRSENLLPDYLYILLQTKFVQKQIQLNYIQTTLPKLGLDRVLSLRFPEIPEKTEQKKIIDLFHDSFNSKNEKEAQAKQLLESIDEYLLEELGITLPEKDNSLENRIFTTSVSKVSGWRFDCDYYQIHYTAIENAINSTKYPIKKIRQLIAFIESGSRPKGGVGNIESGIFSIGGEHVNDKCEVGIGKPKYIPVVFHEKYLNTETKLNDVILVKDGATTGKVGVLENEKFVGQNINEHVFLIRPNENEITALYLTYFLHTKIGQILLKREITGATVTGLTKEAVKSILVPVPPIEKQNKIAEHIRQIREQAKQLQKEAVEELDKVKQVVEQIILGNA